MNSKKETITITAEGQELERLAELLGDGRCFEVVKEKRTNNDDNNGMLKALRFHFKPY